jgi:hypothetical protein
VKKDLIANSVGEGEQKNRTVVGKGKGERLFDFLATRSDKSANKRVGRGSTVSITN